MHRFTTRFLVLLFLATSVFAMATVLQPRAVQWGRPVNSAGLAQILLGEGRRLFASQLFSQADVTFHSGYYPSFFDLAQAPHDSRHLHEEESEEAEAKEASFLGPPRDWIERFGRHFMVTQHTHLHGGREREILPWLRLAADLDPQRVDSYVVAAYMLRHKLGQVGEAERFLRQGWQANPDSYEILLELGRLYREDLHDNTRARNVWQLALRRWQEREAGKPHPDFRARADIAINLARLEEAEGNYPEAISCLELVKASTRQVVLIQKQIDELKKKCRPSAEKETHGE